MKIDSNIRKCLREMLDAEPNTKFYAAWRSKSVLKLIAGGYAEIYTVSGLQAPLARLTNSGREFAYKVLHG